jgi:hypothetical protein
MSREQYKYPESYEGLTKEQAEAFDAENREIHKRNSEELKRLVDQLCTFLEDRYQFTNERKYLRKLRLPWPGVSVVSRLSDMERSKQKEAETKRKEQEAKEREQAERALIVDAVNWLREKGKEAGRDYDPANAVASANELSYELEIKARTEAGGFIDFEGQNCDGPCEGWDMESRRCDCGNRRVSWASGYGHSFKHPCVYAEAY